MMDGFGSLFDPNDTSMPPMMKRMMISQMFGIQEEDEAIWKRGTVVGEAIRATTMGQPMKDDWGVVGMRLYGPTMKMNHASLRLSVPNTISLTPDDAKELAASIIEWAEEVGEQYDGAVKQAGEYDLMSMLSGGIAAS